MTSAAEKLYEEALSLSEETREELTMRLLDTLAPPLSQDNEKAWREEVMRRVDEVRRGDVQTESWEEVLAHLNG